MCRNALIVFALLTVGAFSLHADELFVQGSAGNYGLCPYAETFSSGYVSSVCPTTTVSGSEGTAIDSGIASGNLSTGLFGVYSAAASTGTGSDAVEMSAEVEYNFSVSGITDGTVGFVLALTPLTLFTNGGGDVYGIFSLLSGDEHSILGSNFQVDSALVVPIIVPITNGEATLAFEMNSYAACGSPYISISSCSALADFLDPIAITGATIYDTTGDVVPKATLVSQTGFNPNAVQTPEPSSILLLGTGLLALIWNGIPRFSRTR